MTELKKLRLAKFKKSILAGKTQTQSAIDAGAPASSAHVTGSRMMKEPDVVNALEAAYRKAELNEAYLASRLKCGADQKPSFLQLEYIDRIKDGLGYGKDNKPAEGANTFNILSIIQQHGLVSKTGDPIEAQRLVEP